MTTSHHFHNVSDSPSTIAKNDDIGRVAISGPCSVLEEYPGAKGGAGVYQTIINQIPPHDVFIEAFVGSGQITLHKRPALSTIVIDIDPAVISAWQNKPGITTVCDDARSWLKNYRFSGSEVVYCDPPYLRALRSCQRDYYRYGFETEEEHISLLEILRRLPTKIIVSGYPSDLYSRILPDWRLVTFQTVNRAGRLATECLWMNYPLPFALHDYRFLGRNFRERERIKRKKMRWRSKLASMPILERSAVLQAIQDLTTQSGDAGSHHQL